MVDEGHYLGPHSDSHPLYCDWDSRDKSLVTEDFFTADLQKNLAALRAVGAMRPGTPAYFVRALRVVQPRACRVEPQGGRRVGELHAGQRVESRLHARGPSEVRFVTADSRRHSGVRAEGPARAERVSAACCTWDRGGGIRFIRSLGRCAMC